MCMYGYVLRDILGYMLVIGTQVGGALVRSRILITIYYNFRVHLVCVV